MKEQDYITDEEFASVYFDCYAEDEKIWEEQENENNRIIKSWGRKGQKYFKILTDDVFVYYIELVSDKERIQYLHDKHAKEQNKEETFWRFKKIYIEQNGGGYTGDDWAGDIYVFIKNKWYQISYSC